MPNINYTEFAITAADHMVDRAILAALIGQSDQAADCIESGNQAIMAAKKSLPDCNKKTAPIYNRQIARISADLYRIRSILTI